MEKRQTIDNFYETHLDVMPKDVTKYIGHFNVFKLENLRDSVTKCSSYGRKEFYKISLMSGENIYHYADETVKIKKNALVFTNPRVSYHWEHLTEDQEGYFCLFTEEFFPPSNIGAIHNYPVFNVEGQSVFLLTDEQYANFERLFTSMLSEIESDYRYKYDVLRNLIYEIVHDALKTVPAIGLHNNVSASQRISSTFIEFLERQFPVESPTQRIICKSAVDFADLINVHVNHLNKAVKQTTGKTTSMIITERLMQEARILLEHTQWTVSEIGYALGFEELSHFINFFKKNQKITPKAFRER